MKYCLISLVYSESWNWSIHHWFKYLIKSKRFLKPWVFWSDSNGQPTGSVVPHVQSNEFSRRRVVDLRVVGPLFRACAMSSTCFNVSTCFNPLKRLLLMISWRCSTMFTRLSKPACQVVLPLKNRPKGICLVTTRCPRTRMDLWLDKAKLLSAPQHLIVLQHLKQIQQLLFWKFFEIEFQKRFARISPPTTPKTNL